MCAWQSGGKRGVDACWGRTMRNDHPDAGIVVPFPGRPGRVPDEVQREAWQAFRDASIAHAQRHTRETAARMAHAFADFTNLFVNDDPSDGGPGMVA